jgi:MFS family permease
MFTDKHRQEPAMLAAIVFIALTLSMMFLCGRLTAKHAAQRGRSRSAWFVLGSLFFPLPSIVLALLPPRHPDEAAIPN